MRRRRAWIAVGVALAALGLVALRWWAAEYVFAPRLAGDDPRTVLTAYFDAQRWGLDGVAESAESPEMRAFREAPNYVSPLVNDAFLASDLVIEGPADIPAWNTHDEEVQFTVAYRSRWRSVIGEQPGPRFWFVYLGRDAGGSWEVLGQGTGP